MEKFTVKKETDKISSINRTIRFKPDHYGKITDLCDKTGVSFNKIVIQCLEYALKNSGSKTQSFIFSPSVDLSFPGGGGDFLKVLSVKEGEKETLALDGPDIIPNLRILEFQDIKNEAILSLELNRGFDARIFHVHSGPSGREEYQSTCLMPILSLSLDRGKAWKAAFSIKINS